MYYGAGGLLFIIGLVLLLMGYTMIGLVLILLALFAGGFGFYGGRRRAL
jgi:hypothetical protein